MARGTVFEGFYINANFRSDSGGSDSRPIARMILDKNQVPSQGVVGSPLTGYDIKSQDCVQMLRLSLLDQFKQSEDFPEVYCGKDGVARVVAGGEAATGGLGRLVLVTESSNYINKVDHVLVKGKDPLPTRYTKGAINVMGNGTVEYYQFSCSFGYPTKNTVLGNEAWAEFQTSAQSEETQQRLKDAVSRHNWESLVGYKVAFASIPQHVSFSLSQSTPKSIPIPFGNNFDTSITLQIGDNLPDAGGIVDVSNVNALGAQVLDLVNGASLVSQFGPEVMEGAPIDYGFSSSDYYCLLDHQCGILQINRGENWFLLPAGENSCNVMLRKSGASRDANNIFTPGSLDYEVHYLRRMNGSIQSIADLINHNKENGDPYMNTFNGIVDGNPFRGEIIAGIGGSNGIEVQGLMLSYSIAKPSIKITSSHGDAGYWASVMAAGGVNYTPIVIQDEPAPTGWNGSVVYPPAPPDDEAEAYDVDSPIDVLEGTVIDLSAPFLGAEGVAQLSSKISTMINGDSGQYRTYSYTHGGHDLLPGMQFEGGVIQSVEYNYADKDSVSTNVTTGPRYYPIGSYSDSQYVKRQETITRNARVVAGSNKDGQFTVEVDGLGRYEAINGQLEAIYPGDKCEVRLMNVCVEK